MRLPANYTDDTQMQETYSRNLGFGKRKQWVHVMMTGSFLRVAKKEGIKQKTNL